MDIQHIRQKHQPDRFGDNQIVDFLHTHLEQYGDPKEDIERCINYVYYRGGFILIAHEGERIMGVTIINKTGMKGFIPENILVYIAVDKAFRGKGIGKTLVTKALAVARGDMALHVEADNPARHLYEKIGFTNKYLEMRYKKAN